MCEYGDVSISGISMMFLGFITGLIIMAPIIYFIFFNDHED